MKLMFLITQHPLQTRLLKAIQASLPSGNWCPDMSDNEPKLVNLAFRVESIDDVETFVEQTPYWKKNAVYEIDGERFLEAAIGNLRINFFEAAIYDAPLQKLGPDFLHASFLVPDLDAMASDSGWKDKLVWGPETIKGGFGHRRIAFFEPFDGCRIEFMENVDE